ncbi:MAG: radical SAM protein [Acidobacteria bacterium]|nr:radical SAM protein [Acidobacteriota bacterium]
MPHSNNSRPVKEVFQGWGRILGGYSPMLSIEITRECPLTCPGCYAYNPEHLGGLTTLRELSDRKGPELVNGILELIHKHRPFQVSLVGGEPLVRYRELNELLPKMAAMGIMTQVVTSAVRPIPQEWASIPRLNITVSIDGLQPEHDQRRKPATYARILQNIAGHQITVHCTVTRQQVNRDGYLEEFAQFWSGQSTVKRIWFSLYTPQVGEVSDERLSPSDRERVVRELQTLRIKYPKLEMPPGLIAAYAEPPASPAECTFTRLTHCVSADLKKQITPCQFGGNPDCANCGCVASAGLAAISRHKLPGGIRIGTLVDASLKIGASVRTLRESLSNGRGPEPSLEKGTNPA